jgi:predicted esterase
MEKTVREGVRKTVAYHLCGRCHHTHIDPPILHDTGDTVVPITGSYAIYHALKDNGVTVKFIAIPTAGHEPGDPVHDSDKDRVWLEWFDKYLK